MLHFAFAAAAALLSAEPASAAPVAVHETYVVRHLQKQPGDDPSLTPEGAAGAERLAEILADKGVVAIFATETKRAMETGAPLAKRLGVALTPYDPGDPDALVKAAAEAAGPVLVVGHSNTVPDLVARFGGAKPAPLSDDSYGTIFIVAPGGEVTTVELALTREAARR